MGLLVPTLSLAWLPTREFAAETTPLTPLVPLAQVSAPALVAVPFAQATERTKKLPLERVTMCPKAAVVPHEDKQPTESPALSPVSVEIRAPVRLLYKYTAPELVATALSRGDTTTMRFRAVPLFFNSYTALPNLSPAVGVGSTRPVTPAPALAATISMFLGSSNSCPALPLAALASTMPWYARVSRLETSTWPPLPPLAPPRAAMRLSKLVFCSDQTTAVPPLPFRRAETSISLADTLVVSALVRSASAP